MPPKTSLPKITANATAAHEVALAHFLAAYLAGSEFDTETYDVGDEVEGKDLEEAEPEVLEDVHSGLAHCKAVLVTDVPHAEEGCGSGGYHHQDKETLEVYGIAHVCALEGHGAGHVKECLKSVDGAVKPVELAAFFENLVHIF